MKESFVHFCSQRPDCNSLDNGQVVFILFNVRVVNVASCPVDVIYLSHADLCVSASKLNFTLNDQFYLRLFTIVILLNRQCIFTQTCSGFKLQQQSRIACSAVANCPICTNLKMTLDFSLQCTSRQVNKQFYSQTFLQNKHICRHRFEGEKHVYHWQAGTYFKSIIDLCDGLLRYILKITLLDYSML